MAQIKTFSWTNANPALARNISVGFTVAEILTIDVTNGGSWIWVTGMPAASSMVVETGAVSLANGFTPLAQNPAYGATISGFTNANPGVLTVNDTATFGFAVGDTVKVAELADDLTGASLNGSYTIASLTATTITLVESTAALSVYVSGGRVTRVMDVNDVPITIFNFAIQGMTIGSTPVGANSADMVCIVKGQNSVV